MKIAFCLYGQPRKYMNGYIIFKEFLDRHPNIEVDFYYHTWFDENALYYEASPWRDIGKQELQINKDIIRELNNLYKPKSFLVEKPKIFDTNKYKNSLAFSNTKNEKMKSNLSNVLSLLYTKNKVRELVHNEIEENHTKYDFIIASRFDFLNPISIHLNSIDINKMYIKRRIRNNSPIMDDSFAIMPVDHFLNIFNAYNNLDKMINNTDIDKIMKKNNELLQFNGEEMVMSNFLLYYENFDKVVYSDLIPNFV
jgi:hypothetical protein